ncbi:MAG: hypothetical protein PHX83_06045 [Acidobacteriia bacterium]|nr:hypothetical protein [Terriglobia bacterium]
MKTHNHVGMTQLLMISLCLLLLPALLLAVNPRSQCVTIQSGTLLDSAGHLITTGYDQWGYNYQAHMFNGYYDNFSRPNIPVTDGDTLEMKWNDAWLSNRDCDGDGKLDRHFGYASYKGSGAWLTNHQWGEYEASGQTYKWDYFVKIVAAPMDAVSRSGNWYTSDGMLIGYSIWGEFAVIQEVYNDQGTGDHGLLYKSLVAPGFGVYKP